MPRTRGGLWTRDELLLAMNLYLRIPFGQQHSGNGEVKKLAAALGRTPSSVAMKLNNLTSIDPAEKGRVRGLRGASSLDREVFAEFQQRSEAVEAESQALWDARVEHSTEDEAATPIVTEAEAVVRVRLAQKFFRRVVLANFEGACALTGITHPALLNASHIVGWAEDASMRTIAGNGIALNRLHDAAFDRKLITFDEDLRLVIGPRLRETLTHEQLSGAFLEYEGHQLREPVRHPLVVAALERHRDAFATVNR